jgi:hypothetical protein
MLNRSAIFSPFLVKKGHDVVIVTFHDEITLREIDEMPTRLSPHLNLIPLK